MIYQAGFYSALRGYNWAMALTLWAEPEWSEQEVHEFAIGFNDGRGEVAMIQQQELWKYDPTCPDCSGTGRITEVVLDAPYVTTSLECDCNG